MKLNPKFTGGLAWAGLILVVAVPSVEVLRGSDTPQSLSARPETPAAAIPVIAPSRQADAAVTPAKAVIDIDRSAAPARATDPVQTASAKPAGNAVDRYISSGKPMPDYISGGSSPAAANAPPAAPRTERPVATIPTLPPSEAGTKVAAVDPSAIVPYPMPRALRPAERPELAGVRTAAIGSTAPARTLPRGDTPVVIVDETRLNRTPVAYPDRVAPVRPTPDGGEGRIVRPEELEGWTSGSLADYLAARGMLSESEPPRRIPPRQPVPPADVGANDSYVPGGFWLSDRPYDRW